MQPYGYIVHGILQARILEWVRVSPGDLSNLGIEPRSPTLHTNSSPAEPQGKPIYKYGTGDFMETQTLSSLNALISETRKVRKPQWIK